MFIVYDFLCYIFQNAVNSKFELKYLVCENLRLSFSQSDLV